MVADGVEQSIGVGRYAAAGVGDDLGQAAAGIERGQFRDQGAVRIGVSRGIDFEDVGSSRFDRDGGLRASVMFPKCLY